MKIVLGSASPRRQELIRRIAPEFILAPADVDETLPEDIGIEFAPVYLAAVKSEAISPKFPHDLVITADTVVIADGEIFGKPKDRDDAYRMLRILSGNTHKVITGCCLSKDGESQCFFEETYVTFYPLEEEEIQQYLNSGEYVGKAGGYAIQEAGSLFVEKIEGDFYNVVGLPLARLHREIQNFIR